MALPELCSGGAIEHDEREDHDHSARDKPCREVGRASFERPEPCSPERGIAGVPLSLSLDNRFFTFYYWAIIGFAILQF
jgi:hypothetical protein